MAATALDALRTPEQAEVLLTLLRAHPELNAEAEWVATSLLARPASHEVSAALAKTLTGYEFEDMDAPEVGFGDPDDACAYLVTKALDPYLDEIRRRAALGLTNAAHSIATGVLQSLYDLRGYEDSDEHVLGGAGELAEYARQVTILLDELDIPLHHDTLLEVCPSWPVVSP